MVAESHDAGEEVSAIDCPVLVTERMLLRAPHEDDVPELVQLADNYKVAAMLGRMPHPYRESDARGFVTRTARGAAPGGVYAITLAESGAFVGCCGLDARNGTLDLGYWIGEPYWGRGYATEAAHALVDLAFRASSIERLTVSCRVINAASRRVIHKCGFQYAGQGMLDSLAAGRVPIECYRLDRGTWVSLRSWGPV